MILFFLRHGEAGMNFPSDFERELTNGGVDASLSIGAFCRKTNITFTNVISSPLIRAKQTAQEIVKYFSIIQIEESEFLTPDSDPKNLFNFLRSFTSDSRVLLVTHEPFIGTCISALISGASSTFPVALISAAKSELAPFWGVGAVVLFVMTLSLLVFVARVMKKSGDSSAQIAATLAGG